MRGRPDGPDASRMSSWAWFLMAVMTALWLVVAVAAVYIAVTVTRDRDDRGSQT